MSNEPKTDIKIRCSTRDRLKKLKLTKLDTFDEIINRLLDKSESK